jgi:hypothetical protein
MLFIWDNGKMEKDTEKVNKFGLMGLITRVTGLMIWQMEKED